MATRQVGDETLSPRAYDLFLVTTRWALDLIELRVEDPVAAAAAMRTLLGAR